MRPQDWADQTSSGFTAVDQKLVSVTLMIGQLLSGRYKLIRPLGAGGMGQTYIAEDTQRPGNPVCVVKQLKLPTHDSSFVAIAKFIPGTTATTSIK
jgi:serine/threonine protein kinase